MRMATVSWMRRKCRTATGPARADGRNARRIRTGAMHAQREFWSSGRQPDPGPPDESDDALVMRVAAGDQAAWRQLVARHLSGLGRSEEHTSELQALMSSSYA